jgi:hypothetical protein
MPLKFWRKLPGAKDLVFVEVHQNGELLSKTARPLRKSGSIYLTANPNGELTAPYYPLPSDIRLLTMTDRGVELDLDPNWVGFTTHDGKIENISSDRRSAYTHIMKHGDFGSIAYGDLRILIRIGRAHALSRPAIRPTGEYRGSILEFWWGKEFVGLGVGIFASLVLTLGFVFGLKARPDDRAKTFVELPDEYTLPFINPIHFSQGPESQQASYDRRRPILSAVSFTDDFVKIALDLNPEPKKEYAYASPILSSAAGLYQERFQEDARRAYKASAEREKREGKHLSDKNNGLVAIPVVQGEALNAKLLRVQKTLEAWYESTAYMVDQRGKTTAEFAQDKGYDFKNYKTVDKGAPKAKAPFKPTGDEDLMYKSAQGLAEAAARERKALSRLRARFEPLRPETSRPLSFAKDSDYTPSMTGRDFIELNRKIDGIMASLFDPEKPKTIQEPIIGTLDSRLIEKTVDRSRFELQLCYELALRRNQSAAGLMEWRWNLDTKGRVTDLELIDSDISDGKMIACIRDKLSRWNWPKPSKGTVQVSFPFTFKPLKG